MEKTKEYYIELLKITAGKEGRLPKKSDFSEDDVNRIKGFFGPWPWALEAAGLKESKKEERSEKNRESICVHMKDGSSSEPLRKKRKAKMGFKGYHPIVNLIFFGSIVVFALLFKHPAAVAVCFFAALCYYIKLCGRAAVKTFFVFLLPMLVFVLLISGFTAHYGVTPLLTLPDGNKLTLEAIVYGFVLGLMTVTVIIWFSCYNEVVTADKFMFVFGRVLPAGALVISMALRFIPMYKKRLKTIAEAQSGIGMNYSTGTIKERIKHAGKIVSILITWSLENAVETSDSMRARGYGLKGRKNYGRFRWRAGDITAVSLMLLLDGILAFGYIKKSLYCEYNPCIKISEFSASGIITFAAFVLLCFLPLIIDLKEDIKWNRLKSKI